MSNSYFTASGQPSTGAFAASAPMRTEFSSIETGFNKLPALTASTAIVVNGAGTALGNTVGTLALAGNFATTGAFSVTLAASAGVTLTLPAVSGTLATLAGTETLSNKTMIAPSLGTPTVLVGTNITGTAAGLTAGNVTTNASLTGPITSVGNSTSIAAQTGTGSTFVMQASPTLTTPVLGVATVTSINGLTVTTGTGTLAVGNGATITLGASATLTVSASKAVVISASLTLAGTDGKTLTVAKSLTLDGTDATTMTFPTTSATIARTDAGQTFTGAQVFTSAVTLGTQQSTQGSLVLANTAVGAFATTLKSSNSATAAWTMTLPTTAGISGQFLQVGAAGATSWVTGNAAFSQVDTQTVSGTPSTITFTSMTSEDIIIDCAPLQTTSGTTSLRLTLSTDNGSNFSSQIQLDGTTFTTSDRYGAFLISGLKSGRVTIWAYATGGTTASAPASTPVLIAAAACNISTVLSSSAINCIRLAWASGTTFVNGGVVTLLGRG